MDEEKCILIARQIVKKTLDEYFKEPNKKKHVWEFFQQEMKKHLELSDDEYDAVIDCIYDVFEDIESLER